MPYHSVILIDSLNFEYSVLKREEKEDFKQTIVIILNYSNNFLLDRDKIVK